MRCSHQWLTPKSNRKDTALLSHIGVFDPIYSFQRINIPRHLSLHKLEEEIIRETFGRVDIPWPSATNEAGGGRGAASVCIGDIHFKLITFGGNALFRVYAHCPDNDATAQGLFEAGQYLLRIHQPGHRETGQIRLELEWLSAMRREAGLPVPEPVCTTGGELLVQVEVRGVPGVRACSLLRWVKGRSAGGREKQEHYWKQGQLMAKLHHFAATWPIPPGCTKRHYNWDGLFKNDTGIGMPASKAWQFLTPDYVEPFKVVTQRVRQLMDTWGTGLDVYGLIHADLGLDANLLLWEGEPRAIDFDDCGFGYWMYDLAVALEHCRDFAIFSPCREALFDGYATIRTLPSHQIVQLDLFMAALDVYVGLWAAAAAHLHPRYRESLQERIDRAALWITRYLQGDSSFQI
jgi:Ser/Thr protein kinase RdoA (MazF antagonist)